MSRTIVVEPLEHGRIGSMNYAETLPLADHEVVLTFDDGPLPPYTDKILDILARECVKATYFMVGSMARAYPDKARKVFEAGHTIGTHSMSHPIPFGRLGLERTKGQIDDGIKATQAALGDVGQLAPFFRFPGFARSEAAEDYLAERGLMVWGADVPADDWRHIGPAEVAKRGLRRLDAMGKGVLLLHDIHQRTVEALPIILKELKARGFRVVHVVPATADRPKTITTAEQWRVRDLPRRPLPVLALADLQDMSGLFVVDRSADELCSLRRLNPERVAKNATQRHRLSEVRHRHRVSDRHRAHVSERSDTDARATPRRSKATRAAKVTHETRATPESKATREGRVTRETKVAGIGLVGLFSPSSEADGTRNGPHRRVRHAPPGKSKIASTPNASADVHSDR